MPCRIYKLDFQEINLNLDRDYRQTISWYNVKTSVEELKINLNKMRMLWISFDFPIYRVD